MDTSRLHSLAAVGGSAVHVVCRYLTDIVLSVPLHVCPDVERWLL